jgi:mycothiol synthase
MILEPRPYRDEQDLEKMRAVLIRGRRANSPTFYVHVGDLNWWLFYLDQDADRRQRVYLWEKGYTGGPIIGWSLFSPRFRAFDVFVHPAERNSRQAWHMLTWTEERMSEMARAQGSQDLRTMWVSEGDSELIAHLERRGLWRSEDYLLCMARPLDDVIPAPRLPEGYGVRHVAGEREVSQRAAASYAAFGSGKPFELYCRDYLRFMRSPVYPPDLDLVVVTPNGQFAAFCICWLEDVNKVGLFEPVGTHPDWQGQGLGKAVLCEGLRRMKERGMTTANVCVEHDNRAARRLYESVGFDVVRKIHTYVKDL